MLLLFNDFTIFFLVLFLLKGENTKIYKGALVLKSTMNAEFINPTMVRGVKKFRWECPFCKTRFNLDVLRKEWNCKNCKFLLEIGFNDSSK